MENTYIYLVENCYGDPKKYYIGKSINPNRRKRQHQEKFGKSITFTIIDQGLDWKFLESFWIEQFRAFGLKLLNKNKGGGGPEYMSEQSRVKLSSSKKESMPWNRGLKIGSYSAEERAQLSEMRKGKINIKPVLQFTKDGVFLREWTSSSTAARELNILPSSIHNNLCGLSKSAGGYVWKNTSE